MSFEDNKVDKCCDSLKNEDTMKVDESNKNQNRTHHTRFFEKLYGNLDKSSDTKTTTEKIAVNAIKSRELAHSPCESSESSSNEINLTRWIDDLGIEKLSINQVSHRDFRLTNELMPHTILPSPFATLRLPVFSADPHNHFAAFCK